MSGGEGEGEADREGRERDLSHPSYWPMILFKLYSEPCPRRRVFDLHLPFHPHWPRQLDFQPMPPPPPLPPPPQKKQSSEILRFPMYPRKCNCRFPYPLPPYPPTHSAIHHSPFTVHYPLFTIHPPCCIFRGNLLTSHHLCLFFW